MAGARGGGSVGRPGVLQWEEFGRRLGGIWEEFSALVYLVYLPCEVYKWDLSFSALVYIYYVRPINGTFQNLCLQWEDKQGLLHAHAPHTAHGTISKVRALVYLLYKTHYIEDF